MGDAFRTLSHEGSIRGMTIDGTDVVAEIVEKQQVEPPLAQLVAHATIGCAMVQRLMSPDQRMQMTIQSANGRVFIDSFPDGTMRGLAMGVVELGAETILQVTRILDNDELHVGSVETSPAGLTASLAAYMKDSEQITAMLDIYVAPDLSKVGGWMLQALPDPDPQTIAQSIEHLDTLPSPETLWQFGAEFLATMVHGIPHKIFEEPPIRFGCNCSKERVLSALRTLPNVDLREIIDDPAPIACDYCMTEYLVTESEIRALIQSVN